MNFREIQDLIELVEALSLQWDTSPHISTDEVGFLSCGTRYWKPTNLSERC